MASKVHFALKDISLDDDEVVEKENSPTKLRNLRKGMSRSTKDLNRAKTLKLDSDDEDDDKEDEDSLDDAGS